MKKKVIMFLIATFAVGIVSLPAQSKQEKKREKKEAVRKLVESKNFKIDVQTAMPLSGRSVPLSSSFTLEVRNDSVFSQLPYFGRAYRIPYGGGDGLRFEAPIKDYTQTWGKKEKAEIKFVAQNTEDRYEFNIEIYSNGSASIYVNMHNRQSIRFHGMTMQD